MKKYLILLFILFPLFGYCDENDSLANSGGQKVELSRVRPVFLEFSYRSLPAINSFPEGKSSNFENNKQYRIKLNLPIKTSGNLNIIGQLRYNNEQLHLGRNQNMKEQDIHFDNIGASILLKYQFDNQYFIAGHSSGSFKADKIQFESYNSIFDFSSSLIVGKSTSTGQIGGGVIFGNSMGRLRIYPLLLWDHQVSNKLRLEMKLPKQVYTRFIIKPDNFYLLSGVELNAASYSLSQMISSLPNNIEFRRASVDLKISLEKEIYDFLWFRADVGLTTPVYSSIVEREKPTNQKLLDLDQKFSPFTGFSIYLVPPKKMFNKKKF